jgi:hypothetical protein
MFNKRVMKFRNMLFLGLLLAGIGANFAFTSKSAGPSVGYYYSPQGYCTEGELYQDDCATNYTGPECTVEFGTQREAYSTYEDFYACSDPLYQFN